MNTGRFIRDRLPAMFIRAAAVFIIILFMYSYRVSYGLIIAVMIVAAAAEAVTLIIDYLKRKPFYDTLENSLEKLDKKYLLSEMISCPDFYEGSELYEALSESNKSMCENVAEYRRSAEDFREFIELWVHEIKLPIASLLLMAHNNKSEISEKMHTQLRRIDGYTDQVLYYARSENAEKDYIIKEVQLKRVVSAAAIKNKEDLLLNSVQLNISELDFTVRTDSKWLEYIISQFMANSMKYRSPDREPEIDISAEKTADSVVLKFRDNGIGIPESDMPYIFGKSFTGENGRTHNKSTGMGLYIVHNLCQRLGHRVEAESVQGEFTEFRIIFGNNSFLDLTEL